MIFSNECYTCIINQAISAARAVGVESAVEERMIREAMQMLLDRPASVDIPEFHAGLWPRLGAISGCSDPYKSLRLESTEQALSWVDGLRSGIQAAQDQFDAGIRVAIAGNIIDTAVGIPGDIWSQVKQIIDQPFAIDDTALLREKLAVAENILYLCDNAGETVFDRLFIETLGKPVTYVVKGGPILNDSMLSDAKLAGLDQVATLIDNGNDGLGTQLDIASEAFRDAWQRADVIISKGMGNFETLYQADDPRLFFLMKVKCAPNSRKMGVPLGAIVVARSRAF